MRPPKDGTPAKLRARVVREHVHTTMIRVRALGLNRDAARCTSIDEVSWASLDLYTIALDLCEVRVHRDLVAQARATIQAHLTR